MKGIVFTKFIEMVEAQFSIDTAEDMIEACDLPNGGAYTSVGTYDHQEMVALLVQLSRMTGKPVPDLLRAYGNFLFGQFVQLYPVFFNGVTSSLAFVGLIDGVIHVEVLKLYPDAQLPRFETLSRSDDELKVVYRSDRHLGDLAEGLLEACIAHFGEQASVSLKRENLEEPGEPVCFTMTRRL
ncbi:MAG: heme NO-binding domain-containing protein [Verrucomicrobia bacterium]|nr:heme NO-binding domain-containing protein [Verrucomicrobiota bacterium]